MNLTYDQIRKYFELRLGRSLPAREKVAVKCPYHDDKTASATAFLSGNGGFNCQACAAKGNTFQFEMRYSSCTMEEAKAKIAEITGAELDAIGPKGPCTGVYDFRHVDGTIAFQKRRYSPPNGKKEFFIYRPDGKNGWIAGLTEEQKGKKVLYNLPDLVTANLVFLAEGEKDCDNLSKMDLFPANPDLRVAATTNSEGAWQPGHTPKWCDYYNPYFTGKRVIVFEDNDDSGRAWADHVSAQVSKYAESVRRISFPDLPEKGDVSDWMQTHTEEELRKRIISTPEWKVDGGQQKQDRKVFISAADFSDSVGERIDWIVKGVIQRGANGFFCAYPKGGKAQPLDALIATPNGWKKMGEISVGDFVFGVRGIPIQVLAVHPQGMKQCYEVGLSDGTSVECVADHLWAIQSHGDRNQRKGWRIVATSDIKSILDNGNRRHTHIPITRPVEYSEKKMYLHPYLIGSLIGDGCLAKKDEVSFVSYENDLVNRIGHLLPEGVCLHRYPQGKTFAITTGMRGKANPVLNELRALGLNNIKSKCKFIPSIYLCGSTHQRMELLRGLMDTDGTLAERRKTQFCTISHRLANDVRELCESLGGTATIRFKNTSYVNGATRIKCAGAYEISIKLPRDVGCPFFIERKKKLWEQSRCGFKKPPSRRIVSVSPSHITECQCITVDTFDGLYLTNDYIVTHNSWVALDMLISLSLGVSWLGFDIPQPVKCGLVSREDNAALTAWRLKKLFPGKAAPHPQLLESNLHINSKKQTPKFFLDCDEDVVELIASIKRLELELVVLDVMNVMHNADENDNSEMVKVMAQVRRIQDESGASIGIVHHYSKNQDGNMTQKLRGAGAIAGFAEWLVGLSMVDEDNKVRRMDFELKADEPPDSIYFKIESDALSEITKIKKVEYEVSERPAKKLKKAASDVPFGPRLYEN